MQPCPANPAGTTLVVAAHTREVLWKEAKMKWFLGMVAVLFAGTGACARAEELPAGASVRGDFAAGRPDISLVVPFAISAPEPQPRPPSDDGNDLRWQLGLGFVAQRFQSKPFSVTLYGVQTSVTYFANDWFGIEGNIAGNCRCDGVTVYDEQASYVVFTGGGRVVWHRRRRALKPWVHALGGGPMVKKQTIWGGMKA
jgi:hypothetical protein